MDKLQYIKLENEDGSYSDKIALSVDAKNIDILSQGSDINLSNYIDLNDNNINNLTILTNNNTNAIQSLAEGSPKGVYSSTTSLINANPDTGVYVVTSDGHLYSWTKNGSTPIDLGIYQAAQNTDDVKGLLYNQINKNMKYFLNFQLGFYNTNNGGSISSTNRIRSTPIQFDYDIFLPKTTNTNVQIIFLNSDNTFKYFISHPCSPNKGFYIPKGSRFKLFLDYYTIPSGGRPEITNIEESFLFNDFCIMPYLNYVDEQIRTLNSQGIVIDDDNLKYMFNFIVGRTANGALAQDYDYYSRLANINIIKAERDIIIPHSSIYDIYLTTYNSYNTADILSQAWVDITTNDLLILKGTYFSLTIASHPHGSNEPILYDSYNNTIFKSLEIYYNDTYNIKNNTTELISQLKNDISLDTLSSKYNVSEISTSKISDFVNKIINGKTDNFIFFTDPHTMGSNGSYDLEENNKYLSPIQKYFYNSPCNFVVCGGDWLNTGDTPLQAKNKLSLVHGICKYLFGNNIFQLVGNHDTNQYGANYERIDSQTIANILNNEHGKNYYLFDSPNARYYFIDTDTDVAGQMGTYRWQQIAWLANDLIENDKPHNVFLLHLIYPTGASTDLTTFASNIGLLISAYNSHSSVTLNSINYDFSNCTGKIDYSLVGHNHADFVQSLGGVPVIATINLRKGNTASFDLITVDYTNMTFNSIRVGTGTDRTINLLNP